MDILGIIAGLWAASAIFYWAAVAYGLFLVALAVWMVVSNWQSTVSVFYLTADWVRQQFRG